MTSILSIGSSDTATALELDGVSLRASAGVFNHSALRTSKKARLASATSTAAAAALRRASKLSMIVCRGWINPLCHRVTP
jgi:hypothetical protein